MEYKLNEFATDDYKMLVELSHHQIKIKGVNTIPMTQKEIADECGISYPTTNKLMAILAEKGCIKPTQNKGRYIITPKGLACISEFEKIRVIDNLDAVDEGFIERDPTRKAIIKGKAPSEKKIKYLNQFELHTLLSNLELKSEVNWDWFIPYRQNGNAFFGGVGFDPEGL